MDYHRLYVILSLGCRQCNLLITVHGHQWEIDTDLSQGSSALKHRSGSSKGSHWILIILINVEHLNTQVRQVIYEIFTLLGCVAEVASLEIKIHAWFHNGNCKQRKI